MKKTTNDYVKHQVSGGFKYPLSILNKHHPLQKNSLQNTNFQKKKNKIEPPLSKEETFKALGIDPNIKDEIFLDVEKFSNDNSSQNEDNKINNIFGLKSKSEIADVVIKDIEKRLDKIHKNRNNAEKKIIEIRKKEIENGVFDQQNVRIYEGDERKQYASHFLSTLDASTVENVEAMIVKIEI